MPGCQMRQEMNGKKYSGESLGEPGREESSYHRALCWHPGLCEKRNVQHGIRPQWGWGPGLAEMDWERLLRGSSLGSRRQCCERKWRSWGTDGKEGNQKLALDLQALTSGGTVAVCRAHARSPRDATCIGGSSVRRLWGGTLQEQVLVWVLALAWSPVCSTPSWHLGNQTQLVKCPALQEQARLLLRDPKRGCWEPPGAQLDTLPGPLPGDLPASGQEMGDPCPSTSSSACSQGESRRFLGGSLEHGGQVLLHCRRGDPWARGGARGH
ncbi:unnamed protein product [Lepidochelys olivacea]